ncbi:MAG: 4Fe-4S binding protein [Desulfobacterales bacterium]|nr:4Fe-4S binding protein [Desulfobacterales bacterium]
MFKMTPTIIKNFLSKRATRYYPYEVREPFKDARGELYNEIEKCNFCSACALKCPSQCITVDKKNATWECDPFACVYCGICVDTCPKDSLQQKNTYRKPALERQLIQMKGEVKKKTDKEE